jgi:hypothetical protein
MWFCKHMAGADEGRNKESVKQHLEERVRVILSPQVEVRTGAEGKVFELSTANPELQWREKQGGIEHFL